MVMKTTNILCQALSLSYKNIALFITAELTLWSVTVEFLPNSKIKLFFIISLLLLTAVWSTANIIISITKLCKNPICVNRNNGRCFYVCKGDYAANMKMLIEGIHVSKQPSDAQESMVFAMGIDMSAKLENITSKGILCSVLSLLQNDYNISTRKLQRKIDVALKEAGLDKQNLQYGDCVLIDLPEITCGNFKLLLIVNSKHKTTSVTTTDRDDVAGEDSRKIIIDLFNFIAEKQISNVVLGAFGTNGLGFPYRVILNEISNAYIYSIDKNLYPHNLYLSLREKDMLYHKLNMSDLIMDIRHNLRKIER